MCEHLGNEEAIDQLPISLRHFMKFERSNLHKPEMFQSTEGSVAFDKRYLPQNSGAFRLPCFWIRREHLNVYGTQENATNEINFIDGYSSGQRILFPVHPASFGHYAEFLSRVGAQDSREQGLSIWAVPSSSTRTLLAWPENEGHKATFIKTSLHSDLFGDRRLYTRKVACSVGLSKVMKESRSVLPQTFDYFPESLGFIPRQLTDGGVVIRSVPQGTKDGSIVLAPLFALMGASDGHKPLLLTLAERHRLDPLALIDELLCGRFARLWLQMSMQNGLILEAHGQDLLLTLSPALLPLGHFHYRDLEGLQVDWQLRRSLGLVQPRGMPNAHRWYETYEAWGYPYSQLSWYKLYISLLLYLSLVLKELELALDNWHENGWLSGRRLKGGEVTMMFSKHLMEALSETFNICTGPSYNIVHSLNRFVLLLMKVRRELLSEDGH